MAKQSAEFLINGSSGGFVDPTDRGLAYGDGVFETVLVVGDHWVLWQEHLDRLFHGINRLKLPYANDGRSIKEKVKVLVSRYRENRRTDSPVDFVADSTSKCIVKVIVTRGSGGRGYYPGDCKDASEILSCFPWSGPDSLVFKLGVDVRLLTTRAHSNQQLAGTKHLNRLEQVLASAELSNLEFEGIMCDQAGLLSEGTKSNIILKQHGRWITPSLKYSGVHGVLRRYLLEQGKKLGIVLTEKDISQADCTTIDAMALVNSVFGIIPVRKLDRFELDIDSVINEIQKPIHQIFPF